MKEVKRSVLLNPGPATTTDSVKNAMVVPDICPREKEFGDLTARIQKGLVDVVNGGEGYVAVLFGGSGTGAMEACIGSVVPGDKKVLIVENGAYGRRMTDIARHYGIDIVEYQLDWGDYPDVGMIDRLLKDHTGEVSHLAMVHHETTTGMLNPMEACAEIAQRHGVEIIVDAISSYAGVPIDIQEHKIDYLLASANKCIQGMAGVGFVICRRESLEKTAQIPPRLYYLDLYEQHRHFQEHHQFRFTPPVQVLYALEQALQEYFEETGPKRCQRYARSCRILVEGLEQMGFRLLLPDEWRSNILTAVIEPDHPAYSYDAMHDYLFDKGFTIYPGKGAKERTFRLANLGQIDGRDIRAFMEALEGYLREKRMTGRLYSE